MTRPNGATCLVTGATGFVGQTLCRELARREYMVRAGVRNIAAAARLPSVKEVVQIENLDGTSDLEGALSGVDFIVHLAARVHMMKDLATDPLLEFRKINVEGTLNLARQAAARGVRRFIFISSVKVNGESTPVNRPFTPTDPPSAQDPYGLSKYEAEVGLRRLARESGIEVVIIRPPLIYGPNVKGNFLRLLQWIDRGVPLPFANVDNRRSLLNVHNLVDLIARCIEHPSAAGETFLVSDGADISTGSLVKYLAAALRRAPRLFPVPLLLTHSALKLVGREDLWQRLFGSLLVSCDKVHDLLGWSPPVTVMEGLEEVGAWYIKNKSSR